MRFVIFPVFHLLILGISFNEEQLRNKDSILVTLETSQSDISGKLFNFLQSLYNLAIFVTFLVFQFPISGIDSKEEQPLNREFISVTLLVSQ